MRGRFKKGSWTFPCHSRGKGRDGVLSLLSGMQGHLSARLDKEVFTEEASLKTEVDNWEHWAPGEAQKRGLEQDHPD